MCLLCQVLQEWELRHQGLAAKNHCMQQTLEACCVCYVTGAMLYRHVVVVYEALLQALSTCLTSGTSRHFRRGTRIVLRYLSLTRTTYAAVDSVGFLCKVAGNRSSAMLEAMKVSLSWDSAEAYWSYDSRVAQRCRSWNDTVVGPDHTWKRMLPVFVLTFGKYMHTHALLKHLHWP